MSIGENNKYQLKFARFSQIDLNVTLIKKNNEDVIYQKSYYFFHYSKYKWNWLVLRAVNIASKDILKKGFKSTSQSHTNTITLARNI